MENDLRMFYFEPIAKISVTNYKVFILFFHMVVLDHGNQSRQVLLSIFELCSTVSNLLKSVHTFRHLFSEIFEVV